MKVCHHSVMLWDWCRQLLSTNGCTYKWSYCTICMSPHLMFFLTISHYGF